MMLMSGPTRALNEGHVLTTMDTPGELGPAAQDGDSADVEPPPRRQLEFDWTHEAGDWTAIGPPSTLLDELAHAIEAAPELGRHLAGPQSICVAFLDDKAIRALNARFRDKDAPTNVLSFPAVNGAMPPEGPRFLGDVALAAETAAAEAAERGIPLVDHVRHLVLHGALHLLGFDHESDSEALRMEAIERRILALLGVADPYPDSN
jgi:probable rRNA maturation factor